jgi:hypothetical protein
MSQSEFCISHNLTVYFFHVQIYVEVERARLTHKLAKMKEEEGNITEAANIIQELQVETYGSMEKREKVKHCHFCHHMLGIPSTHVQYFLETSDLVVWQ